MKEKQLTVTLYNHYFSYIPANSKQRDDQNDIEATQYSPQAKPDFGGNPKVASTQYFLVFSNHFEGVLRNMEDATLAMLRKFFQEAFNMCFPTLLGLFFYKSLSQCLYI